MFKWIACTILPCVFLLTAVAAQSQEIDRTIHVTDSPLPERFSKGLPATVADLNNWWHGAIDAPPIGHATAMILDGDEDYLGRFIAAAEAVPAAEATQWAKLFSDMLRFKVVDEQSCNRVRRIMAGESSTARVAIARLFVDSCSVTSDLALVERPDTPWWAVLAQYDRYRRSQWKDATYTSRLGQAARQAFDAGEDGWRQAALTLADLSSPEADRELLSIHAGISDQELADQVALFFRTSKQTEAQARFEAACERLQSHSWCERKSGPDVTASPSWETPKSAVTPPPAVIAQLIEVGFPADLGLDLVGIEGVSAPEILAASRYGTWFDTETSQYPNEHDSLMRNLADLSSADLSGVIFEEIAPPIDTSQAYRLIAYFKGKRYETQAQNLGDWYDVQQTLALLNRILSGVNASDRLVALATEDQTLQVIAARPDVVQKAVAAGLIKLGDPSEAERVGKEFEQQVLESLEKGELDLDP